MGKEVVSRLHLEGDAAKLHYNLLLNDKLPDLTFRFQSGTAAIIGCCILSIWISVWFIQLGWLIFCLAHIIASILLMYLFAYEHNVEWYQENNEYVFMISKVLTKSSMFKIYQRFPSDYISLYKVTRASGPSPASNRDYAIRDENKNDIIELECIQYDYKVREFAEKFNFTIHDETDD